MPPLHEHHAIINIGWLRAAVLGANDGIISTASLLVGIAASGASRHELMMAGVAAGMAGAMSMAAGEYVSVSSQADTERAELVREQLEIHTKPESERRELVDIYVKRGLDADLANRVADQLMATDPLAAHARDELGFSETMAPRPFQAAFASASAFTAGAIPPLLLAATAPREVLVPLLMAATLVLLAVLGAVGARAGRAPLRPAILRVTFWGALAMLATAAVGRLFENFV